MTTIRFGAEGVSLKRQAEARRDGQSLQNKCLRLANHLANKDDSEHDAFYQTPGRVSTEVYGTVTPSKLVFDHSASKKKSVEKVPFLKPWKDDVVTYSYELKPDDVDSMQANEYGKTYEIQHTRDGGTEYKMSQQYDGMNISRIVKTDANGNLLELTEDGYYSSGRIHQP